MSCIYQSVSELKEAIQQGTIKATDITGFDCKHELFVNNQTGDTVFSAYYGTYNACDDVCTLLGIEHMEV